MGRTPRSSLGSSSSAGGVGSSSSSSSILNIDKKWMIRSLGRNDAEFAALELLHRQLRELRQKLVLRDGEHVLVAHVRKYIDEGRFSFIPECKDEDVEIQNEHRNDQDENKNENDPLYEAFLARLVLRRRILNRLCRRLNRVCRVIDGESIAPPHPPRYGDAPYEDVLPPPSVASSSSRPQAQTQQNREFEQENESRRSLAKVQSMELEARKPMDSLENATSSVGFFDHPAEYETAFVWNQEKKEDDDAPMNLRGGIGTVQRNMSHKEKLTEHERWQTDLLARIPDQPSFSDFGMDTIYYESERSQQPIDVSKVDENKLSESEENESGDGNGNGNGKGDDGDDSKDEDGDESKEEDEDGDESKEEDDEESKDEDCEEDISHLFAEEESVEKENEESVSEKDDNAKKTSCESHSPKKLKVECNITKEEGSGEKEAGSTGNEASQPAPKTSLSSKSSGSNNSGSGNGKKQRTKWFSLQPSPSFYDDDLRRLRAIHGHLVETTTRAHIQKIVSEATQEYNRALRVSTQYHNRWLQLRTRTSKTPTLSVKKRDHAVELALARNKWLKRKEMWEAQRAQDRSMATLIESGRLVDRVVVEDIVLQMVEHTAGLPPRPVQSRPGIEPEVRSVMVDLLDRVTVDVNIAGFRYNPHESFEDFVAPPHLVLSEEEDEHNKASTQQELLMVKNFLIKSEEDRRRAWKMLVAAKSDVDKVTVGHLETPPMPPLKVMGNINGSASGSGSGSGNGAMSGMSGMPAPAHYARQHHHHHSHPHPHMPGTTTYVPTTVRSGPMPIAVAPPRTTTSTSAASTTGTTTLDPKYSAESIKARIFPDGSIRPVMAPKKTKDGLYQRPAGRKRKNMEWDPYRGVWTPSTNPQP